MALVWLLGLISCEDITSEDLVLTGNIEDLVPSYVCTLDTYGLIIDDNAYIRMETETHADFDYWGLRISEVEYYLDDQLLGQVTTEPFIFNYKYEGLEAGTYTGKAKITISGDECEDVVIENSEDFTINVLSNDYSLSVDFFIDYNYVFEGETFMLTPYILEETSAEGSYIKQVSYYWDSTLIAQEQSEPFTFEYQVEGKAGTTHNWQASISYYDGAGNSKSYSYIYSNFEILESTDKLLWFDLKSHFQTYKNGQTVSVVLKSYIGSDLNESYSAKLYFEDTLIGQTSTFPYTLDYKLSGIDAGAYQIKCLWYVTDENGEVSLSDTDSSYVVVTE